MGHITCLPEAVVSRLRSSTVLSDIPQIVEELVCNSLDAEATQISVHVFPEDHHVIVEDNGCGISENDFALIGERHATSKIQSLGDLEGGIKTLGFRGEALSSLADVAHVAVTSRAQGCRKAFRKTFKGRKPSFEPSSEPKVSGTRVVAREIFGNQPVRRRLFGTSLASQKKVLQGVKERVVRLALMHPRVAILVKDKTSGLPITASRVPRKCNSGYLWLRTLRWPSRTRFCERKSSVDWIFIKAITWTFIQDSSVVVYQSSVCPEDPNP